MAQEISGSIKVTLRHDYKNVLQLTSVLDSLTKQVDKSFANGTGANQAQHVWHDKRTLNAGASDNLDLTSLANAFGNLTLSKVKAIFVNILTTTSNYRLNIGGASTNAWSAFVADATDKVVVGAGSPFLWVSLVDGGTVDSTHKVLKIENPSAGAVQYEIWILGNGSIA